MLGMCNALGDIDRTTAPTFTLALRDAIDNSEEATARHQTHVLRSSRVRSPASVGTPLVLEFVGWLQTLRPCTDAHATVTVGSRTSLPFV
jgi:hypothetical protein